ncbi:MAG TPA: AsmA family protein [Steroidobacteraceae bacterium]|nr:AsmA family protein [Steroidobacteraceae bacterium]
MRALKILTFAVGGLLALLIIALLALPLFVDPNAYKARIERSVHAATGRQLALSGPLKLSVFPWIALELGPASLSNPAGFAGGPFATLEHAALQVRLLPLLHKQLEFRHIEVEGLALHLMRNARGEGNWQLAATTAGTAGPARPSGSAPQTGSALQLPRLAGLAITDSQVSYEDLLADHLNLKIGAVGMDRPVPVEVQLVLRRSPQALPLQISGRFDLRVSAGSGLRIENLQARADDTTLRGHAALTDLATSAMSFDLSLDQLDVDRYLPRDHGAAPTHAPDETAPSTAPPELLPAEVLRKLRIDGLLGIGQLRIAGMALGDVRVGITARNGITRIAPITARLYGGQYSGEVSVDARGPSSVSVVDQTMTGVDIAPLLADTEHTQRLSGRGNLTCHVSARGSTSDAMIRSLRGHIALSLANGAIEGIDFRAEVNRAMALVGMKGSSDQPGGGGRTRFDTFSMSAEITDGVALTRDLQVGSRHLSLTGGGTANLVTDTLDYRIRAALLGSSTPAAAQTPHALVVLPLTVTGTLASPKVRPDLHALAKELPLDALQKHEGALRQKLLDKLKGLFR